MESNKKLSRKTILIGLVLTFLVVGLIAAFIVVQNSVDVRNQAAELSCKMHKVTCSWKWASDLPAGVDKVE